MNWQSKFVEGLLLVVAAAVVARVVWGLLGPLLPSLFVLSVLGGLLLWLIRGPHARS